MPGHGRSHGTGGGEEPSRPRVHIADAHGVRTGEDAVAEVAKAGRPGASATTQPTGTPAGRPEGRPTVINPREDASVQRSIDRENSAAATLADQGFQIKQNPSPAEVAQARLDTGDVGRPAAKPDYLIEGRVFDCYSPDASKNVRGVWYETGKKVQRQQTQRVVVNLQDWHGDVAALQRQFDDWPIEDLKEVKIVTQDGDVVQIFPKHENE